MPSRLIRLFMLLLLVASMAACDLPSTGDSSTRSAYAIEHFFKDPKAQALGIAAEHGNVAEVRRLMKQEHANPDVLFASDGSGMPLLAWPIYTRNPEGSEGDAGKRCGPDPAMVLLTSVSAQDLQQAPGRPTGSWHRVGSRPRRYRRSTVGRARRLRWPRFRIGWPCFAPHGAAFPCTEAASSLAAHDRGGAAPERWPWD